MSTPRPDGRLADVDFYRRETRVCPPVERCIVREAFRRAGLRLVWEATFPACRSCLVRRSR